ncbi:MAG: acireductone synthase [Proteobacteria bacterium]|nr:acireductone synthase [Pseudomonadota bacterium]MBS0463575.1 acireductone synthase [Pseudomonadota bacterium]
MTTPTAILTDIEGTTSSIAFVHEVLFPYALRELPAFVRAHGHDPEVRRWLDAAALDIGGVVADECIAEILQGWIREDRKHTALKALQGLLWSEGYARGDFRGHVYPDAVAALHRWHADGIALHVYSSGSVGAQKLLFGHSEAGDLTPLFSGYFDTTVGGKREAASYRRIAAELQLPPGEILFLSDVVEELDAAQAAGMRTCLLDRPEDYPTPRDGEATHRHRRVESFAQIEMG